MQIVHLNVHGKIDADGKLRLDVPTSLPAGEADVALTIRAGSPANEAAARIAKLAGQLRWSGDAVAAQREIRDEW
jgi:hypothetical protein